MEPSDDIWKQATKLHLANKFEEAEKLYVMLLEQNHHNKELMATLGSLYIQTNRHGLGIHFLESTIKNGLKQADIYTNLGLAYKQAGQNGKARENFEISIAQEPTPEALTNYSAMFIEAGEDEKCMELCERAIKMRDDLPVAHWNLSIALLANGKWDRGWDEYDWGLKWIGMREDRKAIDVPWWDGTSGKTIWIYGEQGLGDELMFASMLPEVMKTNKVILECHPRLTTLFRNSFPGLTVYGTRTEEKVSWPENHQVDYRLSMGSLAKFYRRSVDLCPGTPYLKTRSILPPLGNKMRIGISWTGGKKQGRIVKRTIPLSWWKTILNNLDCEFISLQYTDCKEELDLMDALGYEIKQYPEINAEDFNETAGIVASCDLVISVCTTVVHLAGALGVPCWCMAPRWPAWRYQNQGKMPWYRSVRLYRQPFIEKEGWLPVVQRVGCDLEDLLDERRKIAA